MTSGEAAGTQIGHYRLLEQIGEGGMGTIWMAEQREPVRRRVALKIVKLGMDTRQVVARFEAERQALALMDHPHIAKVLDAGATEAGRPYFVMEYIKGIPILDYCDRERLDTTARLELFASVCHAIQHAHQKGIIHRDLKPSNILVALHDGVPMPKVIDFGIAKATHGELTTKTLFTEHRQMIGTPAYMSPEQAEMSGLDIDTRSDIYSLGVLLYELLTGTTPFDTKRLLESGLDEMLRAIREDEPHTPSTRISKLGDTGTRTAQQRRVEPRRLCLLLRGDLDWIVMKCLEKDRTRRYETANGLAADLKRHLADEPVTAGPPGSAYKLRKFVRRNRLKVFAGSVVAVALLVGIVAASWGWVEASRANAAALEREVEAQHQASAEQARFARNAEAVAALLDQCADALRAGDASKGTVALDAARKRAGEGGAEGETERLARLDADLELSNALDAIDQFRWTWKGRSFGDPAVAATRTREALQDFGADPEFTAVEEAAARVQASAIRGRLLLVLNRLFFLEGTKERLETLRDLLRRADPDGFRDGFRDAFVARDLLKLQSFARDAALLEQPPEFVAALGQSGVLAEARRREVLQAAAMRRPSDLALLMSMQGLPSMEKEESTPQRIRWLQAALAADPRSAAAYTNLGVSLRDQDRDDAAAACYRQAIALDPENAAVPYNNLGAALNAKGRHAEAIPFSRKSVALDPTWTMAQSNLGEALAALGQWDEAIDCYRNALAVDPKDAYVHAVYGDAMRLTGRIDEAIASYRKSIELDPTRAAPYVQLGETLLKQGKSDEGLACLETAVGIEPRTPSLRGRLGDAYKALGRMDDAIGQLQAAIEIDPNYNAYGSLADALRATGRTKEAIARYRKGLELDPTNATGHLLLSQALRLDGQIDDALLSARRSVELAPTNPKAWFQLGLSQHAKRELEGAIASFRKATELDPSLSENHQNLGVALHESGRDVEALASYRKGAELEPTNVQLQLNLAMTLQTLGQHDDALAAYRHVLELDPRSAMAAYNVGVELGAKKRWDESIAAYRRTLELDPDYAEACCNLATSLQNKGQFAEALPWMRRGHELGSKRAHWKYPSAEWVRLVEKRVELEQSLPALLAGDLEPVDMEERFEFIQMCQVKGFHHAAVELTLDAYGVDASLADDLDGGGRYAGACSAALASAGQGKDAAKLDGSERARMRELAIEWLRADLALHAKRIESGTEEEREQSKNALREWLDEEGLACLRDEQELSKLEEAERAAIERLWKEAERMAPR